MIQRNILGSLCGCLAVYSSLHLPHNLKKVIINGDKLVVSNFLKTINIPISEISYIRENRVINIHPISIYLKNPTDFGSKITFIPVSRWYLPFGTHPIYKELDALINNESNP